MRHFSTLAGPIQKLPNRSNHVVSFKNISSYDNFFYRVWTRIIAFGAIIVLITFSYILLQPAQWIVTQQPDSKIYLANLIMLICLILLQLFALFGTLSASRSTLKAKDPVPVRPPQKLKIAFATTRAPGEPIAMVNKTLIAAKNIRYKQGLVDVWLLDETKNPELQEICNKLGVKYFSRSGILSWNTAKPTNRVLKRCFTNFLWLISFGKKPRYIHKRKPNPFFAAKSKHGNYNSWQSYLRRNNFNYDILASVDTDHVPEPNYLERLLGYFRDPDVAYVVGPQVYGNYSMGLHGLVSRWAESQASFFQSTIQRAGNSSQSSMFVGTNYAVRMEALKQIGGFQPCITEDMATGLAIHSKRNPTTGNRWKSVYTPDILAIGEGPDLWGSYFTQQWRWAAGTFDTWRKMVWRVFFKLSPSAVLHYFLMLTYYPFSAITWLLSITSSLVYLITGATAILAPWGQFVSLYLMTQVMQFSLYFWNRRYNVSPHEPKGSYGITGILLSTLTAPIYLAAFVSVTLGKKNTFIVTPKGGGKKMDRFSTFKIHIYWATILAIAIIYGYKRGHNHPAMLVWTGTMLLICIMPIAIGGGLNLLIRVRNLFNKSLVVIGEKENV